MPGDQIPAGAYPLFSDSQHAALRAARAILAAHDRSVLHLPADYLADTLRMLLAALEPEEVTEHG
jgi:hypothetical protein